MRNEIRVITFLCLLLCLVGSGGCGDDARASSQPDPQPLTDGGGSQPVTDGGDAEPVLDGGADTSPVPSGSLHGVATRFGATDHSGTVVTVEGTALTTTTAADGAYALAGVPAGTYDVVATAPGLVPARRSVQIKAGEDLAVDRIVLRAGRFVTGETDAYFLGFVGSSDRVAYLTDYSQTFGTGSLHVWDEDQGDVAVADDVFFQTVVSPDGKAFAYLTNLSYLAGLGDLYVYDTEKRESSLVGTAVAFSSIHFTPDGQLLTSVQNAQDSKGTLVVWDVDTRQGVTLSDAAWTESVDVSPDGSRILFYENVTITNTVTGDLMLWRRSDGQIFAVGDDAILSLVRLAPDWSAVVFLANLNIATEFGDLYLWDEASTGSPTLLAANASTWAYPSQDGLRIIFHGDCSRDTNAEVVGTIGVWDFASKTGRQVATNVLQNTILVSADEQRVAYLSNVDPATHLGSVGVYDFTHDKSITTGIGDEAGWLTFSQDHAKLLFLTSVDPVNYRGTLRVFDFDSLTTRSIASDVATSPLHATATHAIFLQGLDPMTFKGASLGIYEFATDTQTSLGMDVAQGILVSLDGTRVAFLDAFDADSGLLRIHTLGSGTTETLASGANMTNALFNEDGTRFIFLADFDASDCTGTVSVFDAIKDKVVQMGRATCSTFQLLPDGEHALFSLEQGKTWVQGLDESSPHALDDGADYWSAVYDPTGLLLYTYESNGPIASLAAWDLAASTRLVLAERVSLPTLARDGNRYVFVGNYDNATDCGNAMVWDLEQRSGAVVGHSVPWFAIALEPTNHYLAFLSDYDRTTSTGTLETVDITAGTLASRKLDGAVTFPLFVNGDRVAYVTKPSATDQPWPQGLYVAPLSTP